MKKISNIQDEKSPDTASGLSQAKADLVASELRYRRLFESARDGILILDAETGMVVDVNPFLIELLGFTREAFLGKAIWELGFFKDIVANQENFAKLQQTAYIRYDDKPLETVDGRRIDVEFISNVYLVNHKEVIQCNIRNITDRKKTETYRDMSLKVLQILNGSDELHESIRRVLALVKVQAGADAVGLRLQDDEDFPYFAQEGFSGDFLLTENTLIERGPDGRICRDEDGKACLACTCGLVISGKIDPASPLFTLGGSFWTNDSFPLQALPPDQDPRYHLRNKCMRQGYASIALIPIRNKERIVGLLHLNARRKGCFTLATVKILEDLAAHIGEALIRKRVEEALAKSEREFHSLAESMPQIVWVTRADGWNIYFNQQWVDYTGLTLEASRGHGWNTPFHPDDRQRAWDAWENATKTDGRYSLDYRLRRADGIYRWWLVRGVPLRDTDGKILKWFGTCTDIEHIKQSAIRSASQLDELHRWQDVMLGREERVHELKREVNELLKRLGEQNRYSSQEVP